MIQTRFGWLAAVGMSLALGGIASAEEQNSGELFGKLDRNGDGVLKADEVGEERARFFERLVRVADKDGSGTLTKDEFLAGTNEERPPAGDRPEVRPGDRPAGPRPEGRPPFDGQRFFDRFDTDKDGKVSKDELPAEARDRLKPVFERLGKEEITREEFVRAMGRFAGRPGQKPGDRKPEGPPGGPRPRPRFFDLADSNGDGRVSKDELRKLTERFGELDENQDGELDPRELLGPPPGGRGPEEGRPPERDRRREGDRRPEGPPEAARPGRRPEGRAERRPPRKGGPAAVRTGPTDRDP